MAEVLRIETNALSVKVLADPPRVWWSDGPRESEDEYDTVSDAMRSVALTILARCDVHGAEAWADVL